MKKYVVLAAAIAMVAFAGCKKEENGLVTLTIGVENPVSMDKQSYQPELTSVMFNRLDEMFVNGVSYEVVPLNNDENDFTTDDISFKGQIRVDPTTVNGSAFLAVYPSMTAQGYGLGYDGEYYTCEFLTEPYMVSDIVRGTDGVAFDGFSYNPWPLATYYTCGHCVLEDGRFFLRNTVATLCPSVLYGTAWYNAFADQFGLVRVNNPSELPQITISKVVIESSNAPLTGSAYIADLYTDEPYCVIDGNMGYEIDAYADDSYAYAYTFGYQYDIRYCGEIPVAPITVATALTMDLYFSINGIDYVYEGVPCDVAANVIGRGQRIPLLVNMRDDHIAGTTRNEYMGRFRAL